MAIDKFWMILVIGKGSPGVRHAFLKEAEIEARRLARKEGQIAYILECVEAAVPHVNLEPVKPVGDN